MDIKITHKINAATNATIGKVDFPPWISTPKSKNNGGINGAADLARRYEFEPMPITGRKYASSPQ